MYPHQSDPFDDDSEALLKGPPRSSFAPLAYCDIPPQAPKPHSTFRNALRASPPILAATLWLSMMAYFFHFYMTLPKDAQGRLPRIGEAYSTFPYISCIGAVRLPYFRGFACMVAILVTFSFSLDLWIGRHVRPGRWFRRAKLFFATISSFFLVLLSFESINNGNHLHLIFTSIQIWCMGAAKLSDYFLNRRLRKCDRKRLIRCLQISKLWKRVVGIIAMPTSWTTLSGIYGCRMHVGLLPTNATCYKLASFSAPCEWALAVCWILYLCAVGYDLYHAETVAAIIIAKTSQPGAKHGRSPRVEMRQLRLARVMGGDDDDTGYKSEQTVAGKSYTSVQSRDVGV